MALLNRTTCVTGGGNTGVGNCALVPKNIIGAFIVPNNFSMTEAELADLQTTLREAAAADSPANRIYPIHGFVGITDNTGDLVTETLGYGGISVISEPKYDWTFRFTQGGICLLKQLRTYNNKSVRVLLYDASFVLYGTMVNGEMAGIPLEVFHAMQFTLGDGSGTTTGFNVRMVLDPVYLNDNLAYVETRDEGFLLTEIVGIQDIILQEGAGSAKPAIVVKALAGCSLDDLYEVYAAELAEETLWSATNATSGAAIAITSVADNAAAKGWTITIPATTDPVIISLAPISALVAAGITGYEGKPLRVA